MKDALAWLLRQELARNLELQARREVDLGTAQIDLLELHRAVRRLEGRVGGGEARAGELSRQIGAEDPVERFRAECLRMHDETEELWRKRRALDALNPMGGFSEQRWREFEAQRAEMRRRLATAGLPSDDEAAPA
jgi:hypothetical protein